MNRKPRVPESACFRKVAMASVDANLPPTHLTVMFCLFKSSFRSSSRKLSGENSTLVYLYLRSSASLFTTYLFLNLHHISFVSGRLPKVDQFMVCQSGGKFEPPNFKKSHCVHIAKHMIFFGEALVVISTLNEKKNVLVVMCTLNLKIKIFNLWAL